MEDEAVRDALEALIRARREDYAGLSRLLGRNPAYIQQYIRRGSPRRLAAVDRRALARYFGVAEEVLGGPSDAAARIVPAADPSARALGDLVAVPRLDVGASAGAGAADGDERARAEMGFSPAFLRECGVGRPAALSLIRVAGDSMMPTLLDGDHIMVDCDDREDRLRDGLYVLRFADTLLVKRLALTPHGRIAVRSDNGYVPDLEDVRPSELTVIGRVVWFGRGVR